MHNCKEITERITELLLDGADPRLSLATELRECAECRAGFRALKDTLQLTTRLIDAAAPPDNYWPGYHARLKERLHAAQQPRVEPGQSKADRRPSWLSRLFTSSIRVPVPVAVALVLVAGLAVVLPRRVSNTTSVIHVPVEVPVVKENVVTQVVYRDKQPRRRQKPARTVQTNDAAVASLDGFKPAEEVKLTVIKGGAANEK